MPAREPPHAGGTAYPAVAEGPGAPAACTGPMVPGQRRPPGPMMAGCPAALPRGDAMTGPARPIPAHQGKALAENGKPHRRAPRRADGSAAARPGTPNQDHEDGPRIRAAARLGAFRPDVSWPLCGSAAPSGLPVRDRPARPAAPPSAVAELRYRRHVITAPAARRTISHAGPDNWLIRPLGPFAALGSRRDFGA